MAQIAECECRWGRRVVIFVPVESLRQSADCEPRWGARVAFCCSAASTVMAQIAGHERRWCRRVVLFCAGSAVTTESRF